DSVAQFTDFDGRRLAFIYARGELCSVLLPGGGQRHSEWDRYGRLLSETDPSGRKTTCQYARNSDRLVSVTHPDGSRECQSWDDRGRLITQSDALENTTLYHYPDGEESLPARITDALGGVARLEWDGRGLLTRYTDCSGSVTAYDYDIFGQLTGRTDAEGNVTRYRRDTAGRRECQSWDDSGRLITQSDALENTTLYHYPDGEESLPARITDALGGVARLE
ncbi:type IV secretion protein Rhs, partial [Erwinia amylovora]